MVTRMVKRDGSPVFSVDDWNTGLVVLDCPHCHKRTFVGLLITDRNLHRFERGYHDEIVAVVCGGCGVDSPAIAFEGLFGDTLCPRCASGSSKVARHIAHVKPPYKRSTCEHCNETFKGARVEPIPTYASRVLDDDDPVA